MIQVNLVYKHDIIKKKIEEYFPELVLIEENYLSIVYDTNDDSKYIELLKKCLKESQEFAGLFVSVTKRF